MKTNQKAHDTKSEHRNADSEMKLSDHKVNKMKVQHYNYNIPIRIYMNIYIYGCIRVDPDAVSVCMVRNNLMQWYHTLASGAPWVNFTQFVFYHEDS